MELNILKQMTACPVESFFLISPRMLQSVRRHSAIVLTVTVNGMQETHPVIYLLLKLNHN